MFCGWRPAESAVLWVCLLSMWACVLVCEANSLSRCQNLQLAGITSYRRLVMWCHTKAVRWWNRPTGHEGDQTSSKFPDRRTRLLFLGFDEIMREKYEDRKKLINLRTASIKDGWHTHTHTHTHTYTNTHRHTLCSVVTASGSGLSFSPCPLLVIVCDSAVYCRLICHSDVSVMSESRRLMNVGDESVIICLVSLYSWSDWEASPVNL